MDPYTPLGMPEPVLVSIGEIHCTQTQVITPIGSFPIRGTQWTVSDHSFASSSTATWAIVLAIVLMSFTCGLSLLLLLVKETSVQGFVQVTVYGPHGRTYTSSHAVFGPGAAQDAFNRVAYARRLSLGY